MAGREENRKFAMTHGKHGYSNGDMQPRQEDGGFNRGKEHEYFRNRHVV